MKNPLIPSLKGRAAGRGLGDQPTLVISEWDWRTSGTMPPPNGKVGSDTGDWSSSVTQLYFTAIDVHNIDQSAMLEKVAVNSEIRIHRATNSAIYSRWKVIEVPVKAGSLFNFPVSLVESSGTVSVTTHGCVFGSLAPDAPVPPAPPYITGGPPFPPYVSDAGKYGISVLDYFAGRVITGLAGRSDLSLDDLKREGPQHAYWIAAMMIHLRDDLPIDPTPVPSSEEEGPVMLSAVSAGPHGTVVRLGNGASP